jgi:hypothetical protein
VRALSQAASYEVSNFMRYWPPSHIGGTEKSLPCRGDVIRRLRLPGEISFEVEFRRIRITPWNGTSFEVS